MFSQGKNGRGGPIVLKIERGAALVRRRFDQPLRLTLSDLYATAGLSRSTGAEYKLTYIDEEGDAITIATDDDVKEAVAFARETSSPNLRIKIEKLAESSSKKTDPQHSGGNPWENIAMKTPENVAERSGPLQTSQHQSEWWVATRHTLITASFVFVFGSILFKLLFGVISSTFSIFFLLGGIILKLVPLVILAGLYLKISGLRKGLMKNCSSQWWRPYPGFIKRVRSNRFRRRCPCYRKAQRGNAAENASGEVTTASAPPPVVEEATPDLARLESMGFDRISAQRALRQANNDLADALQTLLSAH